MPMGPFADFDACVLAQKRKGHDDSSAHRICGHIKSRTEGLNEQEAQKVVQHLKFDNKGRLIIAENLRMRIGGTVIQEKVEEQKA